MTALEIKETKYDLLEIKHDLIKAIVETNDVSVLGQMRDYLEGMKEGIVSEPPTKSIQEINQLIEIADKEEGFDYEHFKKRYNL